jgi:hypothetical protein
MEHFELQNKDRMSDIAAGSLEAMTSRSLAGGSGLAGPDRANGEPKTIDLSKRTL